MSIWSTDYRSFLQKLKQARVQINLTQIQVAKKLNKKQSYISKCESGERRVDIAEVKKFAQIYKKPISYFV